MALTVQTQTSTYQFDGPFKDIGDLKALSGIYVITTLHPQGFHDVLDVGESGNVRERIARHDRQDCWRKNAGNGLFASVIYCDEVERLEIEANIRGYFSPVCGSR